MRLPYSLTSSGLVFTEGQSSCRQSTPSETGDWRLWSLTRCRHRRSRCAPRSGGPWPRLEFSRGRTVRVHLIGAAPWAIRHPPSDRTVDVVGLGEVAHTIIRAPHHPDQGLGPANWWRNGSRPLHLNPVGASNGGIGARKSHVWPAAGSRAAALSPGDNKQEQTRRNQ
jgi:hypothetical protein